jgi:hypothetical protein
MYIRRSPGAQSVTLADGRTMTRADLPLAATCRWVASRKAAVVHAVDAGLITADEAMETWGLSDEELGSWRRALARHGAPALKATAVQRYRS